MEKCYFKHATILKEIFGAVSVFVVVLLCFVMLYINSVKPFYSNTLERKYEDNLESNEATIVIGANDTLTQVFRPNEDLRAFSFKFTVSGDIKANAWLRVCLYDSKTGELVDYIKMNITDFPEDSVYSCFTTDLLPANLDGYVIEIQPVDVNDNVRFTFFVTSSDEIDTDNAYISGKDLNGSIIVNYYINKMYNVWPFWVIALFCSILSMLVFLLRKIKIQNLFLVIALGIGMVISFIISPMTGFDMQYHHDIIYVESNKWLGMNGLQSYTEEELCEVQGAYGATPMYYERRACDDVSVYPVLSYFGTGTYLIDIPDVISKKTTDDQGLEIVKQSAMQPDSFSYLYLPQTVAFTIARLCGMNNFWMLFFARWLNYLVFVCATYAAIKMIPIGKKVFFIAGLLPMTLFQTMNLSRDGMIISLAFFMTAKIVELLCTNKKITVWQIVQLVIPAILLAPQKYIYFPFGALVLLVPWFRSNAKTRKRILGFGIVAGIILIIVTIALTWNRLSTYLVFGRMHTASSVDGSTGGYSLLYIVSHPIKTISMVFTTLLAKLGDICEFSIGVRDMNTEANYSGFGNSQTIILALIALLFSAAIPETNERQEISNARTVLKKAKPYSIIAFGLMFAMLIYAVITWTPSGYGILSGLQGRYFTPILPFMVLICCNTAKLEWKQKPKAVFKMAPAILLLISVITYIFYICNGLY